MVALAEYAFFATLLFALLVPAVIILLQWWRTYVNPNFLIRGIPERINDQEARIVHLEKRVADQEAELEVLRQRMDELSDKVSTLIRWNAQ